MYDFHVDPKTVVTMSYDLDVPMPIDKIDAIYMTRRQKERE